MSNFWGYLQSVLILSLGHPEFGIFFFCLIMTIVALLFAAGLSFYFLLFPEVEPPIEEIDFFAQNAEMPGPTTTEL